MQLSGTKIIELKYGNSSVRVLRAGATVSSLVLNGIERLFFNESEDGYSKSDSLAGIPILFPWANRLSEWRIPLNKNTDEADFSKANDFHFIDSKNRAGIFTDSNGLPIHGFLLKRDWLLVEQSSRHLKMRFEPTGADQSVFPFVYSLEVTFFLLENKLQIRFLIENGNQPLPISFGFHPYFRLSAFCDSVKDLRLYLPLHSHIETNDKLLPTGYCEPMGSFWPTSIDGSRRYVELDDGFLLQSDSRSEARIEGLKTKLRLTWSRQFKVAVVYSPVNQDFICFEPMTAPTNSFLKNRFFIDEQASKSIFDLTWLKSNSKQEYSFDIESF
ncbi:MAG: aldose 1-epimerase [Leptonema sp. (in: Bacteria)]|nr:aldose 1-epimerase [Leptonema sp. (in: bacteria)]